MTQEDKDLLLRDLCARLPYGVIGLYSWKNNEPYNRELTGPLFDELQYSWNSTENSKFLPYLRPMSSMTKDEEDELCKLCTLSDCNINAYWECCGVEIIQSHPRYGTYFSTDYSAIDWLNKKMFDYRGLIPKGLALEALEGMYVNETVLEYNAAKPDVDPDEVNENSSRIMVGSKIRSKTNSDVILSIISDDCHGDEFECSNGSVLSLKQIKKYYDIIK